MALTKKKGTKATPKLPDINALKQVNSNDAGAFITHCSRHSIRSSMQTRILHSRISARTPTTRFSVIWTRKMISGILSEDIKRNGLMHNLVVFPSEEEGERSMYSFPVNVVSAL